MTRIIALATTLAVGATGAFAGNVLPAPVEPEPAVQPVAQGGMGYGAYVAAGLGALALGGIIYAIADDDDDDGDNNSSSTTTTN